MEPQFGEEPEMGWIMAAETHGQGLPRKQRGQRSTGRRTNLDPTPMWAIIAPANGPSIALAEKLGFERMQESRYHNEPTLVLRRPAWTKA